MSDTQVSIVADGAVIKEGWLTKRGGRRKNWKKRWFVIRHKTDVEYYEDEEKTQSKGSIPLKSVLKIVPTDFGSKDTTHGLSLTTSNREWMFATESADEQKDWIETIRKATGNSKSIRTYKEGWVTKQGLVVKNWKKRYFALARGSIMYFQTEEDAKTLKSMHFFDEDAFHEAFDRFVKGSIILSDATCEFVGAGEGKQNVWVVRTPLRVFNMFSDSEDEAQSWVQACSTQDYDSLAAGFAIPKKEEEETVVEKHVNAELERIRTAFRALDENGDGEISGDELPFALKYILGYEPAASEIAALIQPFDKDESGTLNIDEFISMANPKLVELRDAQAVVRASRKAQLEDRRSRALADEFEQLDVDGSGSLDASEIHVALLGLGYSTTLSVVRERMATFDQDKDGRLSFDEYRKLVGSSHAAAHALESDDSVVQAAPAAQGESSSAVRMRHLRAEFSLIDTDHSGKISASELQAALSAAFGFELSAAEVQAMIDAKDVNKDGELSFEEYLSIAEPTLSDIKEAESQMAAANVEFDFQDRQHKAQTQFHAIDTEGTGAILAKDYVRAFSGLLGRALSRQQVAQLVAPFDKDATGQLNFVQFLAIADPELQETQANTAWRAQALARRDEVRAIRVTFNKFAKDADTFAVDQLNHAFAEVLGFSISEAELNETTAAIIGGDQVSFDDFLEAVDAQLAKIEFASQRSLQLQNKKLHDEKIAEYTARFRQFDANQNGFLEKAELKKLLNTLPGATATSVLNKVAAFEKEGKTSFTFSEFLAMVDADVARDLAEQEARAQRDAHSQNSQQRLAAVKAAFDHFDKDKNGFISSDELGAALRQLLGYPFAEAEVAAVLANADANHDGKIDLEEWTRLADPQLAAFQDAERQTVFAAQREDRVLRVGAIRAAFDAADKDGQGVIPKSALHQALSTATGRAVTEADVSRLLLSVDQDNSGAISFDEFVALADANLFHTATTADLKAASKSYTNAQELKRREQLRVIFDEFDADKNGSISVDELTKATNQLLGVAISQDAIAAMMQPFDTQRAGSVRFPEFVAMVQAPQSRIRELVSGVALLKHGRKGKPHSRLVVLNVAKKQLNYKSGKVALGDIVSIKSGKHTEVFERATQVPADNCFSLILKAQGNKKNKGSLDFECASRAIRDEWVRKIQVVLPSSAPAAAVAEPEATTEPEAAQEPAQPETATEER